MLLRCEFTYMLHSLIFPLLLLIFFYLCLVFVSLIKCVLVCFSLAYSVWDSLGFLDLGGYFLFHVREFFNYSLLKYFLILFLFFSSSVTPLIRMLVCLMSQRSLRLSSFLFNLVLHSVLLQSFPPFYLPAHLSILLPYFCYWFFPVYFLSQSLCCSLLVV